MNEEIIKSELKCPQCNSSNTWFDKTYNLYSCDDCANIWALDADNSDYDDDDDFDDPSNFDYDGDTGQAFIDGRWVVISPLQWERWNQI